ncbi:Uncharacterised protein [Neisseria meningitidis]|nr:Uncharacterised protein [Neisseria meningitidis]CKK49752.1 Uncharacterised protein [Neisseria meningitidis]CKK54684.1 Uncharacterised protein [Neisseria meningitidis]CKK70827.1 Uncharacterised protein [Neisseria meningitidis]
MPSENLSDGISNLISGRKSERDIAVRINRFAVLPHLEMKLRSRSLGIAHQSDLLPAFDLLAFADQQFLVVPVCGQEGRIMLDDDQIAVSPQTGTCINHFAVSRRQNGLSRISCNIDTLVVAAEIGNHFTLRRTLPNNAADRTRAGRRSGRRLRGGRGNRFIFRSGRGRLRRGLHRRLRGGFHRGLHGSRYGGPAFYG